MSEGINPQDRDIPMSTEPSGSVKGEAETSEEVVSTDRDWLTRAQQNYTTGINYLNTALMDEWERSLDHWNNTHYRRSAYNSKAWRGRSALFRPLSRASERSSGAAAAAAFFSNKDVISITAQNPSNKSAVVAAKWMQMIMQYRLNHGMHWYMNCMGAWQNTRVYGPCISVMDWIYDEEEITEEVEVPVEGLIGKIIPGRTKKEKRKRKVVLKDQPILHLMPVENVVYDPACDWTDPAQSSVYLTLLFPMYVTDVEDRMTGDDPEWHKLSTAHILSASQEHHNTVRQAREGDNRPDSTESQEGRDNQIVWPRLNFLRKDGVDWVYWTLGHEYMLTDPKPVIEEYDINERPVVIGCSVIETHQMSPSSIIKLIAPLQMHVNDISNLRLDNIRLALNKRFILRRGAVIDLEALMLNVPGGAIATDDPERDIKVIQTTDVTASSYKEQERLETESNDVAGVWLGGSVQNNRAQRETVGGMEMLKEGKSELSEFDIRTFSETWVKPTLEMLMKMIQANETDEVIMNFAWDQAMAEIPPEMRMQDDDPAREEVKKFMMNNEMILEVNVGLGATNPEKRIATLLTPLKAFADAAPQAMRNLNWNELFKEIMSTFGWADGSRFLNSDEQITEAQVEEAYQKGLSDGADQDKMARIEMEERVGMEKLRLAEVLGKEELALKYSISVETLESLMQRETIKSKDRRDIAASNANQKNKELTAKVTGQVKSGI